MTISNMKAGDMYMCRCSCRVSIVLVKLQTKFNFFDRFNEVLSIRFTKIRPVVAELFRADGQTKAPKIGINK